ncbi:hypothetical protein [Azospirillum doebereinerae]|uniref:Uncharacterized protein n=1 Tax=Azospirillum doebereinerae TaxID=92933 RepID=A0A3S0UZV8_9PROT|nr:hypothetical protein [Azospirillum doebereinerae]RUQ67791.1 hypothetical protein EJ913_19130 [Azospirillum doebereinerae]
MDGGEDGKGLDTLLLAAETLPHDGADSWELDLFRIALRIARSTEAAVDLKRADLAFKALPDRLRLPLAERAAQLARREAERAAGREGAKGASGLLRRLGRRAAPGSGSTAKERLLRELSLDRLSDS